MATTPGQRFVRRHDAARSSTSNTTAADITYDTAVISEGGYSWSSPEVTVDEAGPYLCIFDIGQVDLASTRAVGTLVPSVNTTDQTRFRATHRYLRNSGGAQQGASIGKCILDLSASDDVKIRNPGALTPTDAVGSYATNSSFGGALQLIRLPDNDWTHVERTSDAAEVGTSDINTTRPWIDSSGTWTTITYDSEVRDDGGLYSGSGGDLTLAANTKYLIVYGATPYSTDASRHTYVVRLQVDSNNVQSLSSYQRNTSSQGPPVNGMYLHETGGSAETLRMQATHEIEGGDAGTPQIADAYMQVIELPSSAEWIHVDNSTTDSMTTALAGTTTWYDTPLSSTFRADGDSNLSLDSGNDAVQNDSGGSLPILAIGWHRWDRDATTSGTRKNPWTRWDNGGSGVGYGVAGAYSRGQQSTDDTWQAHYCSCATMDLANGADLSFQAQDEASGTNSDMGIYASTSRYFLGVQVLNLNTLDAGSATVEPTVGSLVLSGVAPSVSVAQTVSPAPGCLNLVTFVGLELRGQAPTIEVTTTSGLVEEPGAGSLTLTGQAPTQTVNHVVSPGTGALSVSSDAPVVALDRFSFPSVVALVLASDQADRIVNNNRGPPVGQATFATAAASAEIAHNRSTPSGSLSFSGDAPTIGVDVSPAVGALSLTSSAPLANVGDNKVVLPDRDALSIGSDAPNLGVSVNPPAGTLALGSGAGSAEIAHRRESGTGALSLNGQAPSLFSSAAVSPGAGSLAFVGATPSAEIEHNRQTVVGSVTLAGQLPISINSADGPSIEVGTAQLCFVGYSERWGVGLSLQGEAPEVSISSGIVAEPSAGSLSLATAAPSLDSGVFPASATLLTGSDGVSLDFAISPPSGSLTLGPTAPSVGGSKAPTSAALNFATATPALIIGLCAATGTIQLQTGTPSAEIAHTKLAASGSCVIASDAPTASVAQAAPSITVPVGALVLSAAGGSIEIANSGTSISNADASTASPNNYEQCDFTGFRQMPGSLKMTWNKYAVRRKSWEERHPQEFVRSRSEKLTGPKRPEQDDQFIGSDINAIDPEDL